MSPLKPTMTDKLRERLESGLTPRTDKVEFGFSRKIVEADFARRLERESDVMRHVLSYIARGYSGVQGNTEGHSGTHCVEQARAVLALTESK